MLMKSRLWFVTAGLSPEDIIPLGDKDSVPENLEGVYTCPVNLCLPNGLIFWFFLQSFVSVFRFSLCLYLCVCVCVCVLYYVAVTDWGGGGGTFFPSLCITVLIHLRSHFDPMVLLYNLHCAKRRACMNANQWCLCVSEKLKELQTQIEVYKGEPFCTVPPPQLDFFLS